MPGNSIGRELEESSPPSSVKLPIVEIPLGARGTGGQVRLPGHSAGRNGIEPVWGQRHPALDFFSSVFSVTQEPLAPRDMVLGRENWAPGKRQDGSP